MIRTTATTRLTTIFILKTPSSERLDSAENFAQKRASFREMVSVGIEA